MAVKSNRLSSLRNTGIHPQPELFEVRIQLLRRLAVIIPLSCQILEDAVCLNKEEIARRAFLVVENLDECIALIDRVEEAPVFLFARSQCRFGLRAHERRPCALAGMPYKLNVERGPSSRRSLRYAQRGHQMSFFDQRTRNESTEIYAPSFPVWDCWSIAEIVDYNRPFRLQR